MNRKINYLKNSSKYMFYYNKRFKELNVNIERKTSINIENILFILYYS